MATPEPVSLKLTALTQRGLERAEEFAEGLLSQEFLAAHTQQELEHLSALVPEISPDQLKYVRMCARGGAERCGTASQMSGTTVQHARLLRGPILHRTTASCAHAA